MIKLAPLANILRDDLIRERLETLRCLVLHPYFNHAEQDEQQKMIQDLILLFDRRFTVDIGNICGLRVLLKDDLLRLGDDEALCEQDGLDTGGSDENVLDAKNQATWEIILKQARK